MAATDGKRDQAAHEGGSGSDASVQETSPLRWGRENRAAVDAWNAWVDANGLPLSEFRTF